MKVPKFDKFEWFAIAVTILAIALVPLWVSSASPERDYNSYSKEQRDSVIQKIQALEAQTAAQNRANAEAAAAPAPAPEEAPPAFPHTFDSGFITVGCSKTLQDGGIAFLSVAYMDSNGDRRVVMVNERNLHGAILSPGAGDQYGMYPQDFPLVVRQVVEYASQHLSECDVIQG